MILVLPLKGIDLFSDKKIHHHKVHNISIQAKKKKLLRSHKIITLGGAHVFAVGLHLSRQNERAALEAGFTLMKR